MSCFVRWLQLHRNHQQLKHLPEPGCASPCPGSRPRVCFQIEDVAIQSHSDFWVVYEDPEKKPYLTAFAGCDPQFADALRHANCRGSGNHGFSEFGRHLVGGAFLPTADALAGHAQWKAVAVSPR